MSAEHAEHVRRVNGKVASDREELEHLRQSARQARKTFHAYPSHSNEASMAGAEQRLEDFFDAHPALRRTA